jgi:choline dehydrogenase-like flavoprotein
LLIDAREVSDGHDWSCDVCVIGSGPAGISLAQRLIGSPLRVTMVEAGGRGYELGTQTLYRGGVSGDSYYRLDGCRWRMFGGTSNRWGGWCRPLDPADYAAREWLPLSGWPIDAPEVDRYAEAAASLLELPNARFDLESWRERMAAPVILDDTNFENVVIQHSPETNFAERHGPSLVAASNVTVCLHANVTDIRLGPDSQRVHALRVATLAGRTFEVRPRVVVLAAGGIENPRLLLVSRTQRPAGIGNEFDMVGRCFMEHLHVAVGHFMPAAPRTETAFYRRTTFKEANLRGIIVPTAAALDRQRVLTTSIGLEWPSFSLGTPFLGWHPAMMLGPVGLYRRLRSGDHPAMAEAFKNVSNLAWAIPDRLRTAWRARRAASIARIALAPGSLYSLRFCAEQAPHPDNRVSLDERRRDALGLPTSRLEWRIRPFDAESLTRWAKLLCRDLQERGAGTVVWPNGIWDTGAWRDWVVGGPHHMGTTRMSADPRTGVVNGDCRVHSVDNLYIAGSSVFTTGGHANPTFTLVCLALRLADHLRTRLAS